MADPRYRRNKVTGERAVSFDDGKTWEPVGDTGDASVNAALDEDVAAAAVEREAAGPEPVETTGDPEYDAAHAEAMAEGSEPNAPNRLAPDYYDDHPMESVAAAPAPTPSSEPWGQRVQRQANEQLAREAKAYGVGANNPFGAGAEMTGLGAMVSRAMPSWLGGSAPPEGFEDGLQQVGRGFPSPGEAPRPMASNYETAKKREEMYQSEANALAPDAYGLGQGVTENIAMSPLALAGTGEAAVAKTVGTSATAARSAVPTTRQLMASSGAQGATTSMLAALGEAESDAPIGSLEHAQDIGGQVASRGLVGGGLGALTGGALSAAARGYGTTGLRGAGAMGLAGAGYGAYKGATDPEETVLGGAAKYGAGAALLGPMVAGTASMMLPAGAQNWLSRKASTLRAGAPGGYGLDLRRIAEEGDSSVAPGLKGEDALASIGEDIERLGLHEREGWRRWLPFQTAGGYSQKAGALKDKLGKDISGAVDEATAQGVTMPRDQITDDLVARGAAKGTLTPEDESAGDALLDLASRTEKQHGKTMTPAQLLALKKNYEGKAFSADDALDTVRGEMYRDAAGAPRNALHEAMGRTPPAPKAPGKPLFGPEYAGSDTPTLPPMMGPLPASPAELSRLAPPRLPSEARPGAPLLGRDFAGSDTPTIRPPAPVVPLKAPPGFVSPETSRRFFEANRDYPIAQFVDRTSRKRVLQEAGNQQVSLPTLIGGAGGGLPAAGVVALSKAGGKDMAANAARGLVAMAQSRGGMNPYAPMVAGKLAAGGSTPQAPSPLQYPALEQEAPRAPAPAPMPQAQQTPVDRANKQRGNELPSKLKETLQTNPAALGDYGPPLQEAIDSGDELRLAAEIAKLQQDPKFRTRYGSALADMTGSQR